MMQNLIYALIQIIHNLGAVTIIGLSVLGVWSEDQKPKRSVAVLLALAWGVQASSGAFFGLVTYHYYQHLPDIHGVAVAALFLKILCAFFGFTLAASYSIWGKNWGNRSSKIVWRILLALGLTALVAAGFLRWFS